MRWRAKQEYGSAILGKQAELHCSDAAILPAREDVYRRLFNEVIADFFHYVDKVEPRYSPGNALLVVNTQHADELAFLRTRIQSHLDGQVSIGSASSKFAARVAGISSADHCIVAKDEEAAFLAPFPATLLPLNSDMRRRIPMMGIRTIGDYVALSRAAVFEQWGKHGPLVLRSRHWPRLASIAILPTAVGPYTIPGL